VARCKAYQPVIDPPPAFPAPIPVPPPSPAPLLDLQRTFAAAKGASDVAFDISLKIPATSEGAAGLTILSPSGIGFEFDGCGFRFEEIDAPTAGCVLSLISKLGWPALVVEGTGAFADARALAGTRVGLAMINRRPSKEALRKIARHGVERLTAAASEDDPLRKIAASVPTAPILPDLEVAPEPVPIKAEEPKNTDLFDRYLARQEIGAGKLCRIEPAGVVKSECRHKEKGRSAKGGAPQIEPFSPVLGGNRVVMNENRLTLATALEQCAGLAHSRGAARRKELGHRFQPVLVQLIAKDTRDPLSPCHIAGCRGAAAVAGEPRQHFGQRRTPACRDLGHYLPDDRASARTCRLAPELLRFATATPIPRRSAAPIFRRSAYSGRSGGLCR